MKASTVLRSDWLPCAGWIVPALLCAINTQLGLILPYTECGARLKWSALISFAAALLSVAAGAVGLWTTRHNRSDATVPVTAYPLSFGFVSWISALMGLMLAFALVMQGVSALVLTGCER